MTHNGMRVVFPQQRKRDDVTDLAPVKYKVTVVV
jgi:hypothetical protein